jgi:hypothetical protein
MSLSSPTLQNPAQHYFEWKGGKGELQFYDKEKGQSITVPTPFSFIVLDQLHTITGYDKQAESGFWANEVRDIRRDDLTVRTKRGVQYVGPYKSEQGIVQMPKGASYTKSVYVAHKNKAGELIMGNIKFSGSSLSAWIEFTKTTNVTTGRIVMAKGAKQTSSVGDFYPPTFKWEKWDDDEYQAAIKLDQALQDYLSQSLSAPKYNDNAEPIPEELGKATEEQVLEFEKLKADKLADKREDEAIKETVTKGFDDDEPINLDDIPF